MDIISSRKNKSVTLVRQLLRERSERVKSGLFAVEGDHLCGELARNEIFLFVYTQKALDRYGNTVKKCCSVARESVAIADELAEYISDTKSPQGMFAVASMESKNIPEKACTLVVLDAVQDPGNVGTIIRTAEALGFDGVITIGACADVYSPKVLRSSMGSALRMPVEKVNACELKHCLNDFTLYAAMLDDSALKLGREKFVGKTAVVIGSEGAGISQQVAEQCDKKLYIPIHGAESLNAAVAASIIMWEASKK